MNRNICVVGAGRWGSNHIKTLIALSVNLGIVESDEKKRQQLALLYPDTKIYKDITESFQITMTAILSQHCRNTSFVFQTYHKPKKTTPYRKANHTVFFRYRKDCPPCPKQQGASYGRSCHAFQRCNRQNEGDDR